LAGGDDLKKQKEGLDARVERRLMDDLEERIEVFFKPVIFVFSIKSEGEKTFDTLRPAALKTGKHG